MDVTMPQLGETVTEGTITRWLKAVGEHVDADEPLFEVSTDKVDSEVPAPTGGFVTEILVPEGETVDVGTRLAVLADAAPAGGDGAAPAAAAAPADSGESGESRAARADEQPAQQAPAETPETPEPAQPATPAQAPAASAAAPPPAASAPAPPPAPSPPAAPPAPAAPTIPAPASAPPARNGEPLVMSPVVRRLITERGLDPNQLHGTGEGGRITRRDVLAAAPPASAPTSPAPPSAPAAPARPSAPAAPAAPQVAVARGDEVVPFDNIRRRTAEHMVRSKATSAHVYTSVEVDFERVERVRRAHRDEWKSREGFTLTYLPFIVRAFCDGVTEFPHVNASVDGEQLVVHHDVHLGIAVDLDFNGLIAPVVKNADGKRLRLLAREMRDLADRARRKQLSPDEILGGTFTITNAGGYGTLITLPIINQPQVAILSTDGVHKRPVVVEGPDGEDAIAIRPVGVLALAWDHRAFDGAYAAAFLRAMKETLETRDWEAELA